MRILFVVMTACAWAQSGMERPVVGYVTDAAGVWHAVEGVAGAYTVRAEAAEAHEQAPPVGLVLDRRDGIFYVLDSLGGTVDILPGEAGAAVLLDGATLFATPDELVLRRAGDEVRIACTGVTRLRAMSREFVQVSTDSGEMLLRVTPGREALYLLPPTGPAARAKVRR